jgi:hypothetical protein
MNLNDIAMSNPMPPTPPQADPMATLHKMSRTAGAGTQEYIAINGTAVAALLLGLSSILAIVSPILLIVPFTAILVSIIAIRQIRGSGGTQAGIGLSVLGIVFALGFVAAVGGKQLMDIHHQNVETQQIASLMQGLGQDLSQRHYDAAWAKFGPRFQEGFKRQDFDSLWNQIQNSPYYGPIKEIRWNGVPVAISWESDQPYAQGIFVVVLQSGAQDRRMAIFRKSPDQGWLIDGIEGYFEAPKSHG